MGSLAGGLAALLGGTLAGWFSSRELALYLHWSSPGGSEELTVLQFEHWEFLFALSFAREISERVVIQQFAAEAVRTLDQLSPFEGLCAAILANWYASSGEKLVFLEFVIVEKGQRSTVPMR